MKRLMFLVYAFFFNIRAKRLVDNGRVGLVSMHNANFNDGLYEIERELRLRGINKIIRVERTDLKRLVSAIKFCTIDAYRLGGAQWIFLNDNFMPLAYLHPNPDTKIVQVWHGQGAFKKFGLDIPKPDEIRKREIAANGKLTHVVCSSVGVRDIYASAFGVPAENVICTGSPNEDYYFRSHDLKKLRADFDSRYPACRDKYLVLYAPTFRDDAAADKKILENMDFEQLKAAFPKDAEILVRLHPQVHSNVDITGAVDVTSYENVNELCLIADLLITDYSSVCMDFSLVNKPMVFYAYDLDEYVRDRDFYFDYETYVPGPIARDMAELCRIIGEGDFHSEKNEKFREFNFGNPSGTATKELIDYLQ